jgi:iron complex outermembrane receptor protein
MALAVPLAPLHAQAAATAEEQPAGSEQAPAAEAAEADEGEAIVITGSFLETGAKSAMKMDVPVLDTPFSVSSYSEKFVKSLETTSVADLYNYMTGVKKSGNTGYDITLRGFKTGGDDRNGIMVDGLPGLTGRFGSPPTIGVDHIELVKGPMSVLYGQIQPGGFINLITKKPTRRFGAVLELRGTTFVSKYVKDFDRNTVNGAIDVTGAVDDDGTLKGRFVGEITDREGFRDFAFNDSQFLMPSVAWDIGPDTSLTAQYEYRHTKEHFDQFLVAPQVTVDGQTFFDPEQIADITTTYQQPTDFRTETGQAFNVFFNHGFGDNWRLNAGYRRVRYNSNQKEFSNTGFARVAGQPRVLRRARHLQTERRYDYLDISVTGEFDTFGVEHKVLVGFNAGKDLVNENRLKFFNSNVRNVTTGVCPGRTVAGSVIPGTCLDIDLYDPNYSQTPDFNSLPALNPALANQDILLTDRYVRQKNYGIYVSDLLTLTDWLKVSLGARKFQEKAEVEANRRLNSPILVRKDKRNLLPSAGVLIQPNNRITIYGSYAESFVPNDPALQDFEGNVGVFGPIEGKQYEVGIKTEKLWDNRLSLTAALYRIDQSGQVTTEPCVFGTCAFQVGKARSDGFEIEGNLAPVPNWQILFGYAHIKAVVLEPRPGFEFQEGLQLPNVAKDAANLWTRYDWENGFGVGLGVTYTGKRSGVLPNSLTDLSTIPLPAYTVVDLGLYYQQENYSINLKVGNVFDKRYIENTGATARIQIAPGAPRYLTLTGRVTF